MKKVFLASAIAFAAAILAPAPADAFFCFPGGGGTPGGGGNPGMSQPGGFSSPARARGAQRQRDIHQKLRARRAAYSRRHRF